MSDVVSSQPVSAATLQHVIADGDLSRLTPQQRVEYMMKVCETVGLNPFTRPFRFLSLNGQVTLYATRDCADQLRSSRKIDLALIEKRLDGDLFVVTARATTPEGRHDEDVGAVMLGRLQGDARANAVMKAITKAKRRVTLSVCGLGFLDESEVESIAGAQVYDAAPEPAATTEQPSLREQINRDVPVENAAFTAAPAARSWSQWADSLELALHGSRPVDEVARVLARAEVQEVHRRALEGQASPAKTRIRTVVADAELRVAERPPPEEGPKTAGGEFPDWVGLDDAKPEVDPVWDNPAPAEDQR